MKGRINIGTASIILIFIILCLSVFSLLSLSDAKSAEVFSKRRADSVRAYYQTDIQGQKFIKAASEAFNDGMNVPRVAKLLADELPSGSQTSSNEAGNLVCNIPMLSGQSLYIEMDRKDSSVLSYYVYISEDYAIDNKIPVWTGSE